MPAQMQIAKGYLLTSECDKKPQFSYLASLKVQLSPLFSDYTLLDLTSCIYLAESAN